VLPPFDFTPSSLDFIRVEVDSQEKASILAARAIKLFEKMKVFEGYTKLSIMDFMEKYYHRQNAG
jgi:hypothetical protein